MKNQSEYDFDEAVRGWSNPPIDGVAYRRSSFLNDLNDDEVREFVQKFEQVRFNVDQWRNADNGWREHLGMDTVRDKHILDFGCGYGIDGLQFARNGNEVSIADISQDNLNAAERVLNVCGFKPRQKILVSGVHPYYKSEKVDIFYASGVVHHIPYAESLLVRAYESLHSGGELRLLLYSEEIWERLTGTVDIHEDPSTHPKFTEYVRRRDKVGHYTNWYNKEKIELLLGSSYDLERCTLISRGRFYVAVCRRRDG